MANPKTIYTSYFADVGLGHSRIRVKTVSKTYWHICNDLKNIKANHIEAFQKVVWDLGWQGEWAMEIIAKKGYIFIPITNYTTILA